MSRSEPDARRWEGHTGRMRVSVVGTSGAGKTTFARDLAGRMGVPCVELDAIFHQPDWTQLPDDEFRDRVRTATAADGWVCDGNYDIVRPIVLGRATDVVWLDLPRWVVMAQVITRSVRRAISREELWNGNRERWREWVRAEHPIRWAWSTHGRRRADYERRFAEPEYAHLRVHRCRTRRSSAALAASLVSAP